MTFMWRFVSVFTLLGGEFDFIDSSPTKALGSFLICAQYTTEDAATLHFSSQAGKYHQTVPPTGRDRPLRFLSFRGITHDRA